MYEFVVVVKNNNKVFVGLYHFQAKSRKLLGHNMHVTFCGKQRN